MLGFIPYVKCKLGLEYIKWKPYIALLIYNKLELDLLKSDYKDIYRTCNKVEVSICSPYPAISVSPSQQLDGIGKHFCDHVVQEAHSIELHHLSLIFRVSIPAPRLATGVFGEYQVGGYDVFQNNLVHMGRKERY